MDPTTAQLPAWQRAKRDSIVAAATDLLRDRPADSIHMREIAEHAGAALGTVYRYFGTKEQVFLAVLHTWASWADAPPPSVGRTPVERLRGRVATVVGAVEASPHLFLLELTLQSSTDPDVVRAQRDWSAGGAAWLVGDLGAHAGGPAERIAVMLWAIVNHVLKESTLRGTSFDAARQVIDEFIDLIPDEFDSDGAGAGKK